MHFIHQLPLDQSATGTLREGTSIPRGTNMADGQDSYLKRPAVYSALQADWKFLLALRLTISDSGPRQSGQCAAL